jgi:DNA-binding PadR family transcriptional regulator
MPPAPVSVLKGTLDLLVLRTLGGGEEMHGFEILDWITDSTDGSLAVEEGALYPALHRLEKKG